MKLFIDPEIIILDNGDLEKIVALANSGPCVHAGACTGGPASPCSTIDAWH